MRQDLKAARSETATSRKQVPVKIRKAAYGELKELWETINKRCLLVYDKELNDNIEAAALSIFETRGFFTDTVLQVHRDVVVSCLRSGKTVIYRDVNEVMTE